MIAENRAVAVGIKGAARSDDHVAFDRKDRGAVPHETFQARSDLGRDLPAETEGLQGRDLDQFLVLAADRAACLGIYLIGCEPAVGMTDRLMTLAPLERHIPA